MPSKSREQQKMIFAKRGQYKTKGNTPQKDKWVWDSGWEKLEEGEHGTFDWPYLKLGKDGILYNEHGDKIFGNGVPKFKSVEEAEKWLEDNDERGTVTGLKEDEGQEFIDDIKKKPKISLITKTLYPDEMRSNSSNMSTAPVMEEVNRVMFTKLINEVGSPNGEWGVME
jgi:hypothetical protein